MSKKLKFNLILIIISFLFVSLNINIASAVEFEQRDTRIDLPVLSTPNDAVSPSISADNNGHVYVAWSDNRKGAKAIYINTRFSDVGWQPLATPINTGFPKRSAEGDATSPQICADNSGHVYVAWVDDRAVKAGTGKKDIYFRYSKDYGLRWYPEFTDERIDSDNPGIGDSINPRIACDEKGNVFVVWEDDRNKAGIYEIYFRSLQIQFSNPVDFITYYQYPDVRLNTGVDAGNYSANHPVISSDKNANIYVAWQDNRTIPDQSIFPGIYLNVSKNNGSTWGPKATRIDTAPIGGFQIFSPPVISSDSSGHVYVAWLDNAGRANRGEKFAADGTNDVYFNSSSNNGATWGEKDVRIDMTGKRIEVKDVAIANNDRGIVSIAWASNAEATTKGNTTNFNIYFNHSEDFGRSFTDTESNIRIDTGIEPGTTNASLPTVQVNDLGDTFVAWVDKRNTAEDIYFNFSIDKGKKDSWQENDIRLDYPQPPGDSINPLMIIDKLGHVYVVWEDSRDTLAKDNYNIYFISGFLDIEKLLIAGQRIGESCFIATAAFGSPFEQHVQTLRDFRDEYLLTNNLGRWFVSNYYRFSPPAARFISRHNYLRAVVRVALLPAVGIAFISLHATSLQKIVLIISITAVSGVILFLLTRKYPSY